MSKVEVSVKDGGHSIVIDGTELRGSITIIHEEDDNIKKLRRSGLIATKAIVEAEAPAQPEPKHEEELPVWVEPKPEEKKIAIDPPMTGNTGINGGDDNNSGTSGISGKPNRGGTGNRRNRNFRN